jgi:hypothetical protein
MHNEVNIYSKKTLLIDLQYFPCIYYFIALSKAVNCNIEQYESFQKMSFRNRCIILGSQTPTPLTVPVLGGRNQNSLITEVKIDNRQKWQEQHLRAISSCYRRSPFFEHYFEDVEKLLKVPTENLWELNWLILEWLMKKLKIEKSLQKTDGFEKITTDQNVLDLRGKILPKNYADFETPIYDQVFRQRETHLSNLSILDLLFCCGGASGKMLL